MNKVRHSVVSCLTRRGEDAGGASDSEHFYVSSVHRVRVQRGQETALEVGLHYILFLLYIVTYYMPFPGLYHCKPNFM
jgi:hypothetical protein